MGFHLLLVVLKNATRSCRWYSEHQTLSTTRSMVCFDRPAFWDRDPQEKLGLSTIQRAGFLWTLRKCIYIWRDGTGRRNSYFVLESLVIRGSLLFADRIDWLNGFKICVVPSSGCLFYMVFWSLSLAFRSLRFHHQSRRHRQYKCTFFRVLFYLEGCYWLYSLTSSTMFYRNPMHCLLHSGVELTQWSRVLT